MKPYFVYMVQCADATLYTGICTDVERRVKEHNGSTLGAKYTKTRQPVVLIYSETCADRSTALKREHAIRQLSRSEKLMLSQRSQSS
ncbi:MAG TPA: GIY-YIG nuclease family protein [Verrucomicrobiae bacterium]|nr:GIY-YIG nuclease family protein [Verrucomicrobiae bacterium]